MCASAKNLNYSIKGALDICECFATSKSNHKLLRKVAEELDLDMGNMIYIDFISQKKPSYGGCKNWIIIQDSVTKQNGIYSQRQNNI